MSEIKVAQALWSLVPVAARARYVRRAAVAMLDGLDELAPRLAVQTGWPRTHLVRDELLPAVRGLHLLAADGPRALADRRVSPRRERLAGRVTTLVRSPVGSIGLRGPSASPWAEPALEAAAALLAGNAVILAAGVPELRDPFLRAGVPGELLTTGDPADARRVLDLPRPARKGALLVLPGAPREPLLEAALWAAFAGSGRHPAAAGRLVLVEGAVPGLVRALSERAGALRSGDPRDATTDVGPLPDGTFAVPTVVETTADDPRFRDPPPLTLAVVTVANADAAVAVAARDGRDGPISIWARDHAKGERIARRLPSPTTWIGRHGIAPVDAGGRLARHVAPRAIEWRAAWAPGTPRLPIDPGALATWTALTEVRHGRESRRWPALRALARRHR